ncbi:unnamed protein product [Lactuca virosa]|uniref:Transmembrane protein n=1 Tax=Lactuca virosa TaxID=75947 RepID=A0AAU9M143_9ASTR|nr:unnamed protein product [Lactuca virosa]
MAVVTSVQMKTKVAKIPDSNPRWKPISVRGGDSGSSDSNVRPMTFQIKIPITSTLFLLLHPKLRSSTLRLSINRPLIVTEKTNFNPTKIRKGKFFKWRGVVFMIVLVVVLVVVLVDI